MTSLPELCVRKEESLCPSCDVSGMSEVLLRPRLMRLPLVRLKLSLLNYQMFLIFRIASLGQIQFLPLFLRYSRSLQRSLLILP